MYGLYGSRYSKLSNLDPLSIEYSSDTNWTIKRGSDVWTKISSSICGGIVIKYSLIDKRIKNIKNVDDVIVKLIQTPPSDVDITLFWEMVSVVLQYDCYKENMPITTVSNIITILRNHKKMWRKDVILQLLSKEQLYSIVT